MATSRRFLVAGVAGLAVAAFLVPGVASAAATATVVGTVVGPSGEVLASVPVQGPGGTTTTDAHGQYRFTGLTPGGSTSVCARPPANYDGGTAPSGYLLHCNDQFTYGAGRTVSNIRLPLGAGLSGQVLDDRTGLPLAGADVYYESHLADTGIETGETSTAADGTWSLRGLDPARTFYVDAGHTATPAARFGYLSSEEDHTSPDPLHLEAGTVHTGVSFRLRPATRLDGTVALPRDNSVFDDAYLVAGAYASKGFVQAGRGFHVRLAAAYGSAAVGVACVYLPGTRTDPRGLGLQCRSTPLSSTQAASVAFTPTTGGAIRGTVTGVTPTTQLWVDVQGQRLPGQVTVGNAYYVSSLPTGTVVVHAYDPATGASGQSTPVKVFQGHIRAGVDLTLS